MTTWLHTSSVRYLLPSAVTLSALSCGVSAVRAGMPPCFLLLPGNTN